MIVTLRHPRYLERVEDWALWRRAYEGGKNFVNTYLEKFSTREDDNDFKLRKKISYCPRFAGSAIDEVRNSIYHRFVDISRAGGSTSYEKAVKGDLLGVDLLGSSMNSFIGTKVLIELLVMGRVGVYVDFPRVNGNTLMDFGPARPYLYIYTAEEICNWIMDDSEDPNEFSSILLQENYEKLDEETGFPETEEKRYRYMFKREGSVFARWYNSEGDEISEEVLLSISKIPFVMFEISQSLMTDIAQYQVALLNLESSDINYSLKANFPFYTEQKDFRAGNRFGEEDEEEIKVGVTSGRAYTLGADRPGFIHPSSEPLEISMKKQEQLKAEIRQLVGLAISNLAPSRQSSAESKEMDQRGLEAGLSYIGLELEQGERKLAAHWAAYENSTEVATISYPAKYSMKSEKEEREEAAQLADLIPTIPSRSYQKSLQKELVRKLLASKVSREELRRIDEEIDRAQGITSDYKQIAEDVRNGLVDKAVASLLRGYPEGSVDKAKEEHIERLKQIQIAQAPGGGAARGLDDLSTNPKEEAAQEKENGRTDGE